MLPRTIGRAGVGVLLALALTGCGSHYVVLHPAGPVGVSELHLMVETSVAMAVVILFVLALFTYALIRFRDRPGRTAPYTPDHEGERWLEILLFAIPVLIVAIIAVPTVEKTYALDRLPPKTPPLVIQVTSLDWKWLFQYPGEHIASVNTLTVPTGVPVLFELAANSPMNAFWVPQLGGMEYTMPGRVLPLWLEADRAGAYLGRSANFSGRDFAEMTFTVHAVSPAAFAAWVHTVRTASPPLTAAVYRGLLRFGLADAATYSGYPSGIFPALGHSPSLQGGSDMPGMSPSMTSKGGS